MLLAMLASCSKNHTDPLNGYSGTWELRVTTGMPGSKSYPAGNGDKLQFAGDSLIRIAQGQRLFAIRYTIAPDTTHFFGVPRLMDKLTDLNEHSTVTSFFIDLHGDTLTQYYSTPALDGGSASYIRINE